jgi:hypothetical protein
MKLGNSLFQAGASKIVGNLQLEYAFVPINEFVKSPNVNPWENTIHPEKLNEVFRLLDINESLWDMKKYLKEDNWQNAYSKKQGQKNVSNSHIEDDAFRLFPALNPSSLPADSDGFVRTQGKDEMLFEDALGYNTGWRSINFMPYGIFTPHTGSVSGVYVRMAEIFMKNEEGLYDLKTYRRNLELLEHAIQDRVKEDEKYYVGAANKVNVDRGLFPLGTEFRCRGRWE